MTRPLRDVTKGKPHPSDTGKNEKLGVLSLLAEHVCWYVDVCWRVMFFSCSILVVSVFVSFFGHISTQLSPDALVSIRLVIVVVVVGFNHYGCDMCS